MKQHEVLGNSQVIQYSRRKDREWNALKFEEEVGKQLIIKNLDLLISNQNDHHRDKVAQDKNSELRMKQKNKNARPGVDGSEEERNKPG